MHLAERHEPAAAVVSQPRLVQLRAPASAKNGPAARFTPNSPPRKIRGAVRSSSSWAASAALGGSPSSRQAPTVNPAWQTSRSSASAVRIAAASRSRPAAHSVGGPTRGERSSAAGRPTGEHAHSGRCSGIISGGFDHAGCRLDIGAYRPLGTAQIVSPIRPGRADATEVIY
ncbi:hypothetical protein GCM10027615_30340 [Plantactinospora veratri]